MQKNENDVPWNKVRFEITSEGDFKIDSIYEKLSKDTIFHTDYTYDYGCYL